MNQILEIKKENKKLIKFLKFQFAISFIAMIVLFIYILNNSKAETNQKEITKIISQNAKTAVMFGSNNGDNINENNLYFCTLKIEKINLEYFVYKNYSEELLKILPCKFYGGNLGEDGNICIIGHNYFDDRFFGNLDELENGDEIILEDMVGNAYTYSVYYIYEVYEDEIEKVIREDENTRTVTLCTCTSSKSKRLVIRAKI